MAARPWARVDLPEPEGPAIAMITGERAAEEGGLDCFLITNEHDRARERVDGAPERCAPKG